MSWFFDVLWAVIGGAIIGVLGRLLLPGKQNISMTATVIAGIAAALAGGFIAHGLGVGDTNGVDWIRHGIQIALAILFVWLAAKWFPKKGSKQSATQGSPPPTGYPTT
ncbi:MAG TPA: GlsB/YeaQ/YmgE family stress response membrane protein [Micromonosporaceae bacterium]|nr:GlsB/YeaQ/YmgE family stress response membrane protein [Micromonosporaceae bacterium]